MNIINAIISIVNNPDINLANVAQGRNRINNVGVSLEVYIKSLFANALNCTETERNERIAEFFSYTGNQNNPPDAMLKFGDAIEIKKIESNNAALALNSSYPKHKLYANSPMINRACRNAEEWTEKDIIYSVGIVDGNELKHLCFVYGLDYAASDETYIRIKEKIKDGIESIPGVEFAETNELGKVKRVDPLGITDLRVRGMWHIANPWIVFDYIYNRDYTKNFNFMCIINDEKWNTLDNREELITISRTNADLNISDVRIKNPDNPAQLKNAKLITFSR